MITWFHIVSGPRASIHELYQELQNRFKTQEIREIIYLNFVHRAPEPPQPCQLQPPTWGRGRAPSTLKHLTAILTHSHRLPQLQPQSCLSSNCQPRSSNYSGPGRKSPRPQRVVPEGVSDSTYQIIRQKTITMLTALVSLPHQEQRITELTEERNKAESAVTMRRAELIELRTITAALAARGPHPKLVAMIKTKFQTPRNLIALGPSSAPSLSNLDSKPRLTR